MIVEAALAYAHFIAILTLVVFLASEAALCRPEWINAAVVRRLGRIDLIYMIAAIAVLATGVARTWWGLKGAGWYWSQPLLHAKVALFAAVGVLSIKPTRAFIRWRKAIELKQALPPHAEVVAVRRWILLQAHLLILIPIAAVLLARGVGTR